MGITDIFWNMVYSTLILFLGGLGIFITRIKKNKWTNVKWSYLPIFWFPVLSSWPVAIAALIGKFDE